MAELIYRAVAIKAAVVTADLRERTGSGRDVGREALNYGHTLAHAIERYERFAIRHGEAVSIGMVFAAELGLRLGLLDRAAVMLHRDLLRGVGLPTHYDQAPFSALRQTMAIDKKARGSLLRMGWEPRSWWRHRPSRTWNRPTRRSSTDPGVGRRGQCWPRCQIRSEQIDIVVIGPGEGPVRGFLSLI